MSVELEKKLDHYRISANEYGKIKEVLGREPEGVEWALFSALWSEHCSYKSSKVFLKKFYSANERVVESFGENAGVIDLGLKERVAFKMESHNHPSFITPHQGAATGVGGILRDIFTMGARPIALGNYLCFGEPSAPRMKHLVKEVVKGIADYGNCVGVPMLDGQTEFNKSYNGNILVNAFALGLFKGDEKIFTSKASGAGNYLVYVGAKTGRDGVHGASMASESFDDDSEEKKSTVQIGDPFFEKLLIEGCLDVMKEDLVESIQDMGAAGLTSSSFEMASKGGVGLLMNLDKVPVRAENITPEEILLSESQERMLLICKPENFGKIKAVFEKWSLDASHIGEVTDKKTIKLMWHNETLCEIDPDVLVENAPMYNREYTPLQPANRSSDPNEMMLAIGDLKTEILNTLKEVTSTNKSWIYEQYDQRVGAATVNDCSSSVGQVRLPSGRGLGIVLGCRPYLMRFDPLVGAADAVFYPALQLAAKGFEPLAVTDCLNFGNPEKPDVMGEFVASVESMSDACQAIDAPVISGNVSLYNETQNKNVTSTPSTGMVGLKEELSFVSDSFTKPHQSVYLLRLPQLKTTGKYSDSLSEDIKGFGELNNKQVAAFVKLVLKLSTHAGVRATRVVGKNGLGFALARMTEKGIGAEIGAGPWLTVATKDHPKHAFSWFQENLYEVVFALDSVKSSSWLEEYESYKFEYFKSVDKEKSFENATKIDLWKIGETISDKLVLGETIITIDEISNSYKQGWKDNFETLA
ncbi:phosphoribosylformylglycinamidine synthase subunit PurL [bacterium]|nr:phosphoribosylformylglycinamidine synthase subunit PurL [bacterium]